MGSALAAMNAALQDRPVTVAPLSALPLVKCDGILIERVLCNLLENAAKYTPPGSAIHIDALADAHTLQVRVADDGAGVAQADRQRIFEKFRARPARVGPPAQASGWRYAAPSWTPTRAASGSSRPGACAAPASSSRCR